MLLLPLDSTPAKVFTVQLGDGNKYVIETRYNEGFLGDGGFWTFDLSRSIDGVVLVTGVPILLGQDLLSPYALGIGVLVAIDENNTDTDAGPEDLGVRVNVYWATSDELAAAAAAAPPPRIATVVVPVMSTVIPPVPPPFTPLSLGSTLKLWLRGDLGITQSVGNVTAWADQSGNGNNVVNSGTVPYAASAINGMPGATFGAGYLRNTTQSPLSAGSPRTIFIVTEASTSTGGIIYSGRSGTPNGILFLPSSVVTGLMWSDFIDGTRSAFIPVPTINGVPLIVEATHAGTGSFVTCKLSGAAQTVTQSTAVQSDNGAVGFSVGDSSGSFIPNAAIAEVIVCDTVLSAQNELLTRAYLSARYGIG